MIVVVFNPPLEKKDYEWALPKVQATFPDWTWCGSTGTPSVRDRDDILTGTLNNDRIDVIGSFGPYYWDVQDVIDYIKEGYFIKLS